MDVLLPITTLAALLGAYLVSNGNWKGFAIWVITDIIFMINNFLISQWEQGILFGIYLFIAANGVYKFRVKNGENKNILPN